MQHNQKKLILRRSNSKKIINAPSVEDILMFMDKIDSNEGERPEFSICEDDDFEIHIAALFSESKSTLWSVAIYNQKYLNLSNEKKGAQSKDYIFCGCEHRILEKCALEKEFVKTFLEDYLELKDVEETYNWVENAIE